MRFLISCVLSGIFLLGCSSQPDDRPARVPVRGVVKYKGKPVEKANVVFSPIAAGQPGAGAITDANGEFTLKTFEDADGAVPGKYQVGVSRATIDFSQVEEVVEDPDMPPEDYNPFGPPPKTIQELPKKYLSAPTSGLTYEVKDGSENFAEFDLKD